MPAVPLFATCLGDLAFPDAVADAATLLRQAGFEVEFPARQVCCGHPAFNAGHRAAARRVARSFARAFSREAPIVAPSGSCATMASHYLPELVGVEPFDVVYEDFAGRYEDTIRDILRHLGLPEADTIAIAEATRRKQSDGLSRRWAERYKAESGRFAHA